MCVCSSEGIVSELGSEVRSIGSGVGLLVLASAA